MRMQAIGPLLLFIGLAISAAELDAQSITGLQAQVNRLAAAQKKMDSTLVRLEARIAKLETASEEADKHDAGEEAEKEENAKELATLENRIAALERAGPSRGGGNAAPAGRTMRAPFAIEDDDGRVIFRVTGGKSPRLMIGEDKGGSVEMGTGSAGGGIVRVRDASNGDRVILIASDGFGQVRALSQGHSAVITANDEQYGALLSLFNGDTPTARLNSGKQYGIGALRLSNMSGEEIVTAGAVDAGKGAVGIVRTGPKRRPGSLGPPSLIQGAR